MPVKIPILNKKHIGIIGIVAFLAGIIGTSPFLYNTLFEAGNNQPAVENEMVGSEAPADSYKYAFPVINRRAVYYFPYISREHKYFLQPGSPVYIPNFAHPEAGCNWMGVAGQVFDKNDKPIPGYTLVISGTVGGQSVSLNSKTGAAQVYGSGGYEIRLADAPFSSSGSVALYLLDSNLNLMAAPLPLTTYQDCQANLIIINFRSNT